VSGHILVCYGRHDYWYVLQLSAYLADVGISVRHEGVDVAASLGVVLVLTPRSALSDSIQEVIRDAVELQKPILPLLLEPCPPQDIPEPITHLRLEDVVGGQMPGQTLIAQLLALVDPTTASPPDVARSDPTTAELIARYTVVPPSSGGPVPLPSPVSPVPDVSAASTETLVEHEPTQPNRAGLVLPAIAGVVAAAGLVWALASQLPKSTEGSPDVPATPAKTPTAAVSGFISAAEVRDSDALKEYICQRYQGVSWYAADFHAPNFIQAKLVLLTAGTESATANLELSFQEEGDRRLKGVQYSVVTEGGAWKVCGPA
jgi:hypothetical protein